ncbi:response regulator [Flaviaesturariibacter terrae]
MTQSLPPKSLFLYADDDPDDRQLLLEVFSEYATALQLVTFAGGQQLLDYVRALEPLQPQPALVLLDQNMPGVDGLSTLRELRAEPQFDEMPIVLFTTSTQPYDAARARQLGAGFLTKPITSAQVARVVDQMLDYCDEELRARVYRIMGK